MRCVECNRSTLYSRMYCHKCVLKGARLKPALTIGICGKARHGKSTAAAILAGEIANKYVTPDILAISDFVLAEAHKEGLISKESPREALNPEELAKLVILGKGRRAQEPDYWLDAINRYLAKCCPTVLIVPGVRFWNEVVWVGAQNGFMLRIVRPGFVSSDRDPNDETETALDDFVPPFTISANSEAELAEKVKALAEQEFA